MRAAGHAGTATAAAAAATAAPPQPTPPPAPAAMPLAPRPDRPGAAEWWRALGAVTKAVLAAILALHGARAVTGLPSDGAFSLAPSAVLARGEVYRLLTGVLLHASLMHLTVNSLALAPLGTRLESERLGSALMLVVVLGLVATCGLAYALVSGVLAPPALSEGAAVGFSGVLFAMAVLDAQLATSPAPVRVLGLPWLIPGRLAPWVMILLVQVFFPGASFLGHVTGALCGYAWSLGGRYVLPSRQRLAAADASPWFGRPLARLLGGDAYKPVPWSESFPHPFASSPEAESPLAALRACLADVRMPPPHFPPPNPAYARGGGPGHGAASGGQAAGGAPAGPTSSFPTEGGYRLGREP